MLTLLSLSLHLVLVLVTVFLFQCHAVYESAEYDSSSFHPVKQDYLEKILQKLPVAFR